MESGEAIVNFSVDVLYGVHERGALMLQVICSKLTPFSRYNQ